MSYIYLPSIYHIGKKPERILCWVGSYLWFYKIHPHPMGQRWRVSNSSKQTYLGNYMHNELTQPFRVVVPCYLLLRMYVGTWACPPCLLGHKEWRIYDSRNLRENPHFLCPPRPCLLTQDLANFASVCSSPRSGITRVPWGIISVLIGTVPIYLRK